MWPFRRRPRTPEQVEERAWRDYEERLACTLFRTGYRGTPVSWQEAQAWARGYVTECRRQQEEWRRAA